MNYIATALLLVFSVISYGQTPKKKNIQSFLTSQSQRMVIIPGPVKYLMGSPAAEKYRTDDEVQHKVIIPRTFAISTEEITVSQFQKFLEANPDIKQAASQDSSKFLSIENERLLHFSPDGRLLRSCNHKYLLDY